jgi:very-short-patch-repair endonuclease
MAAVLACGPGAVISHRTAGRMWDLPVGAERDEIEVTVVRSRAPIRDGIRARRTTGLNETDVRRLDGVPITSPARTVLDLAAILHPHLLERVVAEAQRRRLVDRRSIADQVLRNARRPGTPVLRGLLELDGDPAFTRSEAERRMLVLIRTAHLPSPLVNARLGRYEVDFLWLEGRLVVEVDGYAYHATRSAFERDRAKDAALQAAGYAVLRVTWRQLVQSPEAVIARLAATLATRSVRLRE